MSAEIENPTYKLETLKDIYELSPVQIIRCMREIAESMATLKAGLAEHGASADLQMPMTWTDDGEARTDFSTNIGDQTISFERPLIEIYADKLTFPKDQTKESLLPLVLLACMAMATDERVIEAIEAACRIAESLVDS